MMGSSRGSVSFQRVAGGCKAARSVPELTPELPGGIEYFWPAKAVICVKGAGLVLCQLGWYRGKSRP